MKEAGRLHIRLVTDLFPPHAGGSRYYYYNLFKRIAGMGENVVVATSRVPGWQEFDAREQTENFKIERHFTALRDLSYSQLPKIAGPLLFEGFNSVAHRPQILHCGDLYPAGLIGVILKRSLNIPFVAYCHGEDITLTARRRFQPKLRNIIYRSADAIIANGSFAIENLLRTGIPQEKVYKITPGLDSRVFFPEAPDPALRRQYGIKDGEVVIVTVARLVARKGHARVIKALAALAPEVPAFKYVVAGRGPMEAELKGLVAELKLQDRVIFAGFVSDDKLNHHYNMADIVALPNTDEDGDVEGFGMVFLEANAAGKPVIGGRSGGTAEAVADGVSGLLVSSDGEHELQDALRRLLRDRYLRERLGAAGLQRARMEFDWDSRATMLREISRDVIASRRRALHTGR
ncbi:glycosyltransferase family 4 protein [Edaphobacter bradus]|uniref:glycosyltransferase family 4 protein n=1 Tax=Edaphobacter bradus TaxID=2259016 RepID=UPI0021E00EE1|nr:glycosyltransferase family 4 protein [Edaphobacter bradus]